MTLNLEREVHQVLQVFGNPLIPKTVPCSDELGLDQPKT